MDEQTQEYDVREDIFDFLEHAQQVREDSGHTENAKLARSVAASDWADAEYAHWNLYKALRLGTVARLVSGEPRSQITTLRTEESDELKHITDALQDELTVQYAREMLAALLRDVQGDACDSGNSYWYIDPWSGDIQLVSYFDVWTDNVKARPNAMEEGRYIFLRCTMDTNEFNKTYAEQLATAGIVKAESGGGDLEGREIVGAQPGQQVVLDEGTTGIRRGAPGEVRRLYDTPSAADEGLVVYYKAFLQDPDAESGWKYCILYEEKVLLETDWPEWVGPPSVYCFATDGIVNQFYQPSEHNHVRGYQSTIDAILARVKDNSEILGDPPFYWSKATDTLNQGKAKLAPGQKFIVDQGDKPEFLQPPTLPSQYMQYIDMLVEMARSLEYPDVLQGQTDQTDVQSGVAVNSLLREADQRSKMRLNNQEENLRKAGKLLCKIIYRRKMELGRILAAEQITAAQQEQDALLMQEAAMYGEQPPEPSQPLDADQIDDETAIQFIPPPFNEVTMEMLDSDFVFSWTIEPVLTREDRIGALLSSFDGAMKIPGTAESAVYFLEMAGSISGQRRLAEELIKKAEPYDAMVQMMKQLQAEQQAMEAGGADGAQEEQNTEVVDG